MHKSLILFTLLLLASPIAAQQDAAEPSGATIEPRHAETVADDGLTLAGDFYLVDPERPTVILLHELYTTRAMWEPVIGLLLAHNYNALAVDLRGFGETRGAIAWQSAVSDVQAWFTWLRIEAGVRGDAISTMGSSMGSTLAINGCANDEHCRTAIAVSPGWAYYNVSVEAAFSEKLGERPVLLVYAENDRWPALGVPRMMEVASDNVVEQAYPRNGHGLDLMRKEQATFVPLFLEWLGAHGG